MRPAGRQIRMFRSMYFTSGETTTPLSTSASTTRCFASRPKRFWTSARVDASRASSAIADVDRAVRPGRHREVLDRLRHALVPVHEQHVARPDRGLELLGFVVDEALVAAPALREELHEPFGQDAGGRAHGSIVRPARERYSSGSSGSSCISRFVLGATRSMRRSGSVSENWLRGMTCETPADFGLPGQLLVDVGEKADDGHSRGDRSLAQFPHGGERVAVGGELDQDRGRVLVRAGLDELLRRDEADRHVQVTGRRLDLRTEEEVLHAGDHAFAHGRTDSITLSRVSGQNIFTRSTVTRLIQ